MKPKTPSKLAIYVRGSTEEQQNTLTAQADTARKYAEWKEASVLGPFIDSGVSGSTSFFERPAVGAMLEAMQREGGTGIILPKLDRGFRDTLDCLFTCAELKKRGIDLHILDLNLDTSTEIGEFVLTVMAAVARLENRRRSTRQKDAFAVMRRGAKLCGKNAPYGWDIADIGGVRTLVVNHREQAILSRLVHGNLSQLSANDARRRLNAEGIKTKQAGQTITRKGQKWVVEGKWSAAAVLSVKKNPRLAQALAAAA
jgi:DNA invertase Pin-like site-specific DNA recombinase